MSIFVSIVIASLFVSSLALVGAVFLVWKNFLSEKVTDYLVSFAAGILLATAFFDLLPEAVRQLANETEITRIFLFTFLGIVAFFFLERFVVWFHHHDETHETKPVIVLILLGDSLHNFIDGIAIAAAYLASPSLGLATTLAITAHEIPHEIVDLSLLLNGGLKKNSALFFNFLSGLTALAGAVAAFYFLENLTGVVPLTLAFTAGMFIYIACVDLIPDLHEKFKRQKNWGQSLPFLLGIIIALVVVKFLEG